MPAFLSVYQPYFSIGQFKLCRDKLLPTSELPLVLPQNNWATLGQSCGTETHMEVKLRLMLVAEGRLNITSSLESITLHVVLFLEFLGRICFLKDHLLKGER